jgi:hypothetical protein
MMGKSGLSLILIPRPLSIAWRGKKHREAKPEIKHEAKVLKV